MSPHSSGRPGGKDHRLYRWVWSRVPGLAVERLEGNVPSVCRMALQESSMDELRRAGGVTECPYCHRILVTDAEDEI